MRKRTTSSRAIEYARRYPGCTAVQIAHALGIGHKHTSVLSALHRAERSGRVVHTNGAGPRGGMVWGKSTIPVASQSPEISAELAERMGFRQ